MPNKIIPFSFENLQVRVVSGGDGEPWFVAADICDAIDVQNVTQAVARLDDERSMFNIDRLLTPLDFGSIVCRKSRAKKARVGIDVLNGAAMSRTAQAMRLFCRLGMSSYGQPGGRSRKAHRCSIGTSTPVRSALPIDVGMAVTNRNWSKAMNTNTINQAVDACHNLFGEHPEDVITPIRSAASALSWLEEIFKTIESEAIRNDINGYRIRDLAAAGAYIAQDVGEYADCRHEAMLDSLRSVGAAPAEGVVA